MRAVKIAVLGGDARMEYAAGELSRLGYAVHSWGRAPYDDLSTFSCRKEAWGSSIDAIMLPLPSSNDGTHLNTPLLRTAEILRIETLVRSFPKAIWLVGRLGDTLLQRLEAAQIRYVDYFNSEILQLKNALPTAEGAIEIALRELPVVLDGTEAAILGYGRIGELLTRKLLSLGAKVTVYARRCESCVRAELSGAASVCLEEEKMKMGSFILPNTRVIFNTIPKRLLSHAVLQGLDSRCIIIDLASAPGGVDMSAAEQLGLRAVWATALPGKCAPESAGIILAQTVDSIIKDSFRRSDFLERRE